MDDAAAAELRKIANLIALRYTAELKKGDRIIFLATAGFPNREIAALTGSSEGSIRGFLSAYRKRPLATQAEE
jgi:hypothetical protein